jgi:hypothetical protein
MTPRLLTLTGSFAGATVEEALDGFEADCSEESYQGLQILERSEVAGGILVRYEVRFKHSVFDDEAWGSYECWAQLEQAGSSYRVVAATAAHHIFSRL